MTRLVWSFQRSSSEILNQIIDVVGIVCNSLPKPNHQAAHEPPRDDNV
ncbi:hypothetical protein VBH83_14425 [Ochrobactrum sp. S1502_03]